ncbi:MAG TPA: anion permease [Candidatus Dorea gallistercoris]|uniref:Anion permease n=1 Tax=Candidatus Dorea gallistercoris TaxID=2838542 RepID=A0A9D1UF54_9FIRM|nr:anion permease [Candidatus Dorea gallistercoris]
MIALYISLAAIILCIFVGFRYKFNIGILAACAACLIGGMLLRISPSDFFSLVPSRTLFTIASITFFYGFALENQTLQQVINTSLVRLQQKKSYIPVFIFVLCLLISGIGVGAPSTCAIIAPIAMSLALSLKAPSVLFAAAVSYGSCIGGNFILGQGGIIAQSLIDGEAAFSGSGQLFILNASFHSLLVFCTLFVSVWLMFRNTSETSNTFSPSAPGFSSIQKRTLGLILAVVFILILFSAASTYFSEATIFSTIDISYIIAVAGVTAMLLRLANAEKVIKNHIPLQTLITFTGMSLLMGVARQAGFVDWLSALVTENVPAFFILPALSLISSSMSCFSSTTSVVLPTLFPLVKDISAAFPALEPELFFSAIFVGSTCSGISPFSTGGALILGSCPEKENRHPL